MSVTRRERLKRRRDASMELEQRDGFSDISDMTIVDSDNMSTLPTFSVSKDSESCLDVQKPLASQQDYRNDVIAKLECEICPMKFDIKRDLKRHTK